MKKVIVCGAGIGGLVSSIYLAHKGFNVEIFEKNDKPGGKVDEIRKDGFRFDKGASFVTMPQVFQNFFKDISRDIKDYLNLIHLESSSKYFWSDGTIFNFFSNPGKLTKELNEVFGVAEQNNFFRFLEYGGLFYELSNENFLNEEFKIRKYISRDGLKNITKFVSGRSINDVSNKFFKNKKLKQLMDRFSVYTGSSPYLSPQFFSIIPYIEYRFGAWYVKGGIYKIAEMLEQLCKEFKINIHYGYELDRIEASSKTISQLGFNTIHGNSKINGFDTLVSNFTNHKSLIDEDYLNNNDWSCSAFILLMAVDREFTELSQHNVLFSDDYEKEFIDIFEKKIPSDDMTIHLSITKKNDEADAPGECENWMVLVNAPFVNENYKWNETNKNKYKEQVIDRIEEFSFLFDKSIRNHIKFCEIYTPLDLMLCYNSEFGSINGLSTNSLYTLLKRPRIKSRKFSNLFFVGGNTQPGGSIPMCFISGKIVSQMIDAGK